MSKPNAAAREGGYPNPFLAGIPSRDGPLRNGSLKEGQGGPEGGLIDRFLQGYESNHTRRAYRHDLTRFFEGLFGGEATLGEVREVELSDVRRFLEEEAKGFGFQTLRRRATALIGFFRWLAEEGLIEESPLARAGGPRDLARKAKARDENSWDEEPGAADKASPAAAASSAVPGKAGDAEAGDAEAGDPEAGGVETAGAEGGTKSEQESDEAKLPAEEETREDISKGDARSEGVEDHGGEDPSAGILSSTLLLSGFSSGPDSSTEDLSLEEIFPEGFLSVPSWAEASLKAGLALSVRFRQDSFEEGTEVSLRFLPGAITRGLALLGDRDRFPGGAVERPYYRLMDSSGTWMVTIWRIGEASEKGGSALGSEATPAGKAGGGGATERAEKRPTGLATRLTLAKPLLDAKNKTHEEGKPPSPRGEEIESEATRILWLLYGRGWALPGPMRELLEEATRTTLWRIGPEPGRAPTRRFDSVGSKEAREQVALEVATVLSKGLGLPKTDRVQIDRVSF